jgi:hypothetical protein
LDKDAFSLYDRTNKHLDSLLKIGMLNTDAVFTSFEMDVLERKTKGDASESAIIKFIEPL